MTLLNRFLIWSLFLLSFALLVGGDFWHNIFRTDHYKAPHFSIPEFVDAKLGLEDINGTLVCFGDFNSDTLFVASLDRGIITPYTWIESSFRFIIAPSGAVTRKGIVSVSAADYNYDGRLDLLVQAENSTLSPPTITLHIYLGSPDTETFTEAPSPVSSALSTVLVLEADGDLRPDLFGTESTTGLRGVWLNKESGWRFEPQANSEASTTPPAPLVSPQLSAFVDVNGDCLADLVTVSCAEGPATACSKPSLEVWLNGVAAPTSASVFTQLTELWALPAGVKQISFADFDADGASDMLMVVAPTVGAGAYVAIAYGKLKPLCNSFIPLSTDTCRALTALCTKDTEWDFPALDPIQAVPSPSSYYVVVMSNLTQTSAVLSGDMTVRIGDYDMDGYPDVVLPLATGLQLWHSRPCDGALCASDAVSSQRRTFAPDLSSAAIRALQDVESAAFMDLGEKGTLDLLVVTKPPNSVPRPATLYNNLVIDAFFLKTLGLNGKCAAWCDTGPKFPPKPYGGVQVGGTFIFTTTRSTGARHLVQATALSQVGVVSMQTPYVFFGLGRTNSYVEMLYYGMPLRQTLNHHYWTPVMPNAQVYVIPYPPDQPASWGMDSFISPADYAGWVFVAFAVALLVNGGIVMFFRSREIREDENEKKASAHLFSFDIL